MTTKNAECREEIQPWPGPGEEPWWWEKCGDTMRNAHIWKHERAETRKQEERFCSPLYIRFGDAPPEGLSIASWDRTKPEMERGLSVFRGYRDEEGVYVVDTRRHLHLLEAYKMCVRESRPVYLVEGVEVGGGACLEPVLDSRTVKLTPLPDGARVRCSGHWQETVRLAQAPLFLLQGAFMPQWMIAEAPEFTVVSEGSLRASGEVSGVDPTTPDGKRELVDRLVACYACPALWGADLHGPEHWKGVAITGARLLRNMPPGPQADALVVFLFSIFHDSCRVDHGCDPWHGWRAVRQAREMLDGKITAKQLEKLAYALEYHDHGKISADPTIGACWDADRLNLWRVDRTPDPRLLSTEAARTPEVIAWTRKLQAEHFSWSEVAALYDDSEQSPAGEGAT